MPQPCAITSLLRLDFLSVQDDLPFDQPSYGECARRNCCVFDLLLLLPSNQKFDPMTLRFSERNNGITG